MTDDYRENPLAIVARHQRIPPVDLRAIAKDIGLGLFWTNLGSDIAGQIVRDKGQVAGFSIFINSEQHINRQRFTLAHEIAHYILHRDLIESGVVDSTMYRSELSDRYEAQANQMASDILMPVRLVKAYLAKHPSASLEETAKAFQVSSAAMKIRLDGLGRRATA